MISRVHAYVSVENGIVLVRDADSMHGTYLDHQMSWTRSTDQPLPPARTPAIGPQIFTFEAADSAGDR